jgi:diguanylate cyclase (GGDEF)-like protein
MISIKEFLEQTQTEALEPETVIQAPATPDRIDPLMLAATLDAYRSSLVEMGHCGQDACPALGEELKQGLRELGVQLEGEATGERIEQVESGVRAHLRGWGRQAAQHYRQKTNDVKEILLVMAQTAESVGERDLRCAQQITAVTNRLKGIANLEDLSEIRESIKKSAWELKTSIDRMSADGKTAIEKLKAEVTHYQTRLEEAETMASRDALTGVRSRAWVEGQIEQALQGPAPFCVAILDLNKFKQVNDQHGHLVGDELLKQFAAKMRSVCRVTDTTGRWGGDEFILLLHCRLQEARAQIDRLREWVCVRYTLQGSSAPVKLRVSASIGVAERQAGETMKDLIDRADADMYREKVAARASNDHSTATE